MLMTKKITKIKQRRKKITDSEKEKEARNIATVDDKNYELSEFGEVEDNSWTKVIPRLPFASREAICRVKNKMGFFKSVL